MKQFIKFCLVGVSNTLISYGVYALCIALGAHYLVGSIVGFVISVLNSFFWNNRFVFKQEDNNRTWWKVLIKTFVSYGFTGFIVSNLLLIMWIEVFNISEFIAPIINLCVTMPLNFIMNKFWAYRKEKVSDGLENENKPKWYTILILCVMIILQLGRIVYVDTFEREGYHGDECYSYWFSNYRGENRDVYKFPINEWQTGDDMYEKITVDEGERFTFSEVHENVRQDMNPPFYHDLLHLFCSVIPGAQPWNCGLVLNVILFIATQIILFILARKLFKSDWLSLICVFLYGFSYGALSTFIYQRAYGFLAFLALSYILLLFDYEHSKELKKIDLILITLVIMTGCLTHYFFWVACLIMSVCIAVSWAIRKKWKHILGLVVSGIMGVLLSLVIYSDSIYNIMRNASGAEGDWLGLSLKMKLRIWKEAVFPQILGFNVDFDESLAVTVIGIIVFAALIFAAVAFITRNETDGRSLLVITKNKIKQGTSALSNWFRKGELIFAVLFLSVTIFLGFLAEFVNINVNSYYLDRYMFPMEPIILIIAIALTRGVVEFFLGKKVIAYIIIGMAFAASFAMVQINGECNYLNEIGEGGVVINELVNGEDCIVIANPDQHWMFYAPDIYTAENYCFITADKLKESFDLIKEYSPGQRKLYIITEWTSFPKNAGDDGVIDTETDNDYENDYENAYYKVIDNIFANDMGITEKEYIKMLTEQIDWIERIDIISNQVSYSGKQNIYQVIIKK